MTAYGYRRKCPMRGFATGVGCKADIGAALLTQLSFMSTRPRGVNQTDDTHEIAFPASPARLCVLCSFVFSCLPGAIITLTNRVVMGQMIIV